MGRSKAATGASITATHSNLTLQINALTQRKALLAATQSYRKLPERTANSWHAWSGPCSRWSVRWHKSRPKDGTPWTASAATYSSCFERKASGKCTARSGLMLPASGFRLFKNLCPPRRQEAVIFALLSGTRISSSASAVLTINMPLTSAAAQNFYESMSRRRRCYK